MAHRIAILSDTHLSPHNGIFYDNFALVREAIHRLQPDCVLNAGDLSMEGAEFDEDLAFARACHDRIRAPVFVVPGNHDVGNDPRRQAKRAVTSERISRFERAFGRCYWGLEAGRWLILGLDSMVLGTGLPEDQIQMEWLSDQVDAAGTRPVMLLLHKPLVLPTKSGEHARGLAIAPEAQPALGRLLARLNLKLVVSGHLHQYLDYELNGIRRIWTPPTSFTTHRAHAPDSRRVMGFVTVDLSDTSAEVKLHQPRELVDHDLRKVWPANRIAPTPPNAPELDEI